MSDRDVNAPDVSVRDAVTARASILASPDGSVALRRLQGALDAGRFAATAEECGPVALLIPRDAAAGLDGATRRWLVQTAVDAGYSHVALEIIPHAESDAALSGGHSA